MRRDHRSSRPAASHPLSDSPAPRPPSRLRLPGPISRSSWALELLRTLGEAISPRAENSSPSPGPSGNRRTGTLPRHRRERTRYRRGIGSACGDFRASSCKRRHHVIRMVRLIHRLRTRDLCQIGTYGESRQRTSVSRSLLQRPVLAHWVPVSNSEASGVPLTRKGQGDDPGRSLTILMEEEQYHE